MEFGDRESFAVEIDLDELYEGVWLYGKFSYWINGCQVGDYNLGTSLRDVLFQMKWIVFDCGSRDGGILCKYSPQKVFSWLDGVLYGSTDCDIGSEVELPDTPARFDIKISVDIFDEWKIYLIECCDNATILFKSTNDSDIRVVSIVVGIFDSVIKDAYNYLNELYEREVAKSS